MDSMVIFFLFAVDDVDVDSSFILGLEVFLFALGKLAFVGFIALTKSAHGTDTQSI